MEATERAALQLSAEQRLRLIELLWDSFVDEVGDDLEVSAEVAAELDRRLEAHRRAPEDALTWEQVSSHVRSPK
jgi:putative addiction module component (TIGR02574 family)